MRGNGKAKRRRPIEREYLTTLNAVVPLTKWQSICERAADDALAGDARARNWLSKWLLGPESRLLTLVAEEADSSPEAAADCEINTRRQRMEANRRADRRNELLFPSLYS